MLCFYVLRPDDVPAGAHVQWEIELLGFEMPQVQINEIVLSKSLVHGDMAQNGDSSE